MQEIRPTANRSAGELVAAGVKDLPWAKHLGKAVFDDAFGYRDEFGMQATLVLVSGRHGRKAHAPMVLIDHQLGGGIKDLFATDDPDRFRREVQRLSALQGFTVRSHSSVAALGILHAAPASPVCAADPDQLEDVGVHLPVLLDRVALLAPPATRSPSHRSAPSSARRRTVRGA